MTNHRDNLYTAMEDLLAENEELREHNKELLEKNKALHKYNTTFAEENRKLNEKVKSYTLEKVYIQNIKENMKKLLGED